MRYLQADLDRQITVSCSPAFAQVFIQLTDDAQDEWMIYLDMECWIKIGSFMDHGDNVPAPPLPVVIAVSRWRRFFKWLSEL